MDLCGEMLLAHLPRDGPFAVEATCLRPSFRRVATRRPSLGRHNAALNVDRMINRFVVFPRHVRSQADRFDYFHVVDHSYSQLIREMPPSRAGVYCHDLIAFRSLLDPVAEPRPRWFRSLMRRVLDGFTKAGLVFCSTEAFRRQIKDTGLVDPDRIVLAPYGVSEEFRPEPGEEATATPLPFGRDVPLLLHVGTAIPRKRIDVLLDTFALVRTRCPGARLVQVGGSWTSEHQEQIDRLGIRNDIVQLRGLTREALAGLYRRASMVLLPSEHEGFGLPVIEALACGAVVVASDLEVFREVAGTAILFAPVGEPEAWATIVSGLLEGRVSPPARQERLARASRYTWTSHARTIAEAYAGLP